MARLRRLAGMAKYQVHDTGWRTDDIPPRQCPIYLRTRPNRAGWQWRSVRAQAGPQTFVAFGLVNIARGNLKSVLIEETAAGPSVIARYEYHGSHPGIHVHAHCDRGGVEVGAGGMSDLLRIPPAGVKHRRTAPMPLSTFWEEACTFFGIRDDLGPLFRTAT